MKVTLRISALILLTMAVIKPALSSELEFDNNSSMMLYVWPMPDNELPMLKAQMPANSLGIKVSLPYAVNKVLIFDSVGMARYKSIRENTICGYYNGAREDSKGIITAAYKAYLIACNNKTIAYIERLNGDQAFLNTFVLDANKRWAAFNIAARTSTNSSTDIISSKRIGFAVKQ